MMEKTKLVPIQIAARHSGLRTGLIRAWEKRYQIVKPQRDDNGRRLYSQEDIERLTHLGRATHFGHRISTLASLPLQQLKQLNEEDQTSTLSKGPVRRTRPDTNSVMQYFDQCVDALGEMESQALWKQMNKSVRDLGALLSLEELLLPLINYVDEGCRFGELNNGHRQLLHEMAQAFLFMLGMQAEPGSNKLIVCHLQEDPELQALRAMVLATHHGWSASYINASEDPETLIDIAWTKKFQVIVIAFSGYGEDAGIPNKLRYLAASKPIRSCEIILLMPDSFVCADGIANETGARLIRESIRLGPLLEQIRQKT